MECATTVAMSFPMKELQFFFKVRRFVRRGREREFAAANVELNPKSLVNGRLLSAPILPPFILVVPNHEFAIFDEDVYESLKEELRLDPQTISLPLNNKPEQFKDTKKGRLSYRLIDDQRTCTLWLTGETYFSNKILKKFQSHFSDPNQVIPGLDPGRSACGIVGTRHLAMQHLDVPKRHLGLDAVVIEAMPGTPTKFEEEPTDLV